MIDAFAYTLAALNALPFAVEDREHDLKPAQYVAIAQAVSQLKPPAGMGAKDWRALVLAVGAAETHYLIRVMDGQCRPLECDKGLARSAWQMHRNLFNAPVWDRLQGLSNIPLQVTTADAMLKRAYHQCRASHVDPLVLVQRTVLGFAGRPCDPHATAAPWRGLGLRTTYWLKARQAMG